MLAFLQMSLATWRLASLLVSEDGPADVFERLRVRVGVYNPGEMSSLAKGLSCIWCVSVWIAPVVLVTHLLCPPAVRVLALSAGAIMVNRFVERIDH